MISGIKGSANYKWWVFGAIAIGTFLSVVDHGSVLVALPSIERHFGSDLPTVQWIVVGYALAISVLILPMGRLGDIIGRKQVYVGGMVIFVAAAGLAGASPNLGSLIAFKVFQGVGSAMVQSAGIAMVISAFPGTERGKALGTHLSVVGAGAIAGPVIGGLLVSIFDWRSVFFANVPVGVFTIAVSMLVLPLDKPEPPAEGEPRQRFDWGGAVLSGLALLGFLLVVGNGDRLGWTSAIVLSGLAASVLAMASFIWWELLSPSPMLDMRLFKRKLVALGVAAGWFSFLGSSAARFMMPFYLQRVLEFGPRDVGLLLIAPALCLVVVGPFSGRLSDRFGWRGLTVGGLTLSATAWFIMAGTLTESSPVLLIVILLMFQSTGTALFNTPNNSSILSAVDRSQYGVVSALTQLVRNSANVTSIAIATTVVVATMGARGVEPSLDAVSPAVAGAFVAGLRWAFLMMGGLLLVGIAIAVIRGERPKPAPPARPVSVVAQPASAESAPD
ncbi:MAG: MFS transporter [Chloroflexi bacterium]|nr:MFS transporter [Chloroflexota bacterium]